MEPLETLQALNLAVKILSEIENLSIDDNVKNQIKQKVLEIVDEVLKPKKRTPGSQQKIIESLRKLGGKAIRSKIAEDSELDPNVVSSLLNRLVKSKKVQKIKIEKSNDNGNRSGRGLEPGYMYVLVDEGDE